MRGWARGAVVALVSALAATGCASDNTLELDGDWAGIDVRRADKPDTALSGHRIRFHGDRFVITRNGKLLFGGRYAIDPEATPPQIDFEQMDTKALSGTWLGVYALDGDILTICDNAYDMTKPRPKSVYDCAAPGYVRFQFKRAR